MKKSRFFLAVISLFVAITSSAQNISVTGVVTDASTGEPIPFAFCQVKGSTKGSSSDADGRYSIPVPSDGTIIFSSMGYEQKEVAVKGKTTINVALTPDSQLLEGVVVTGMQKMDRRLFTGSTAKLDAESAKIDGLTDVSRPPLSAHIPCLRDVSPVCPCRMCRERSEQLLRSVSVAPLPSTAHQSRFGLSMA